MADWTTGHGRNRRPTINVEVGAMLLWIVILVAAFALFVHWADRKNKRHPGNRLGGWGGRSPDLKLPDPLDRTD